MSMKTRHYHTWLPGQPMPSITAMPAFLSDTAASRYMELARADLIAQHPNDDTYKGEAHLFPCTLAACVQDANGLPKRQCGKRTGTWLQGHCYAAALDGSDRCQTHQLFPTPYQVPLRTVYLKGLTYPDWKPTAVLIWRETAKVLWYTRVDNSGESLTRLPKVDSRSGAEVKEYATEEDALQERPQQWAMDTLRQLTYTPRQLRDDLDALDTIPHLGNIRDQTLLVLLDRLEDVQTLAGRLKERMAAELARREG